MARCNRCGKGGLFFRVNAGGRCPECERNLILQSEYIQLEEAVRRMKADLWAAENSYDALKKKEKGLHRQMAGVAKKGPLPEGIPDAGGESAGLPEAVRANVSAYRLMAAIVIGAEFQNLLLNIRYSTQDEAMEHIKAIAATCREIAGGDPDAAPFVGNYIDDVERLLTEAIRNQYHATEEQKKPSHPKRQGGSRGREETRSKVPKTAPAESGSKKKKR